jgi:hypothetical protein
MDEWEIHCRILGVSPDSTAAEIKKSYTAQAKLFHPDKHDDNPIAKQKFQQLQESYEYLKKNKRQQSRVSNNRPSPRKNQKHTTLWIYFAGFCFVVITLLTFVFWPQKRSMMATPPSLSFEDVEEVLKQNRLFIYQVDSNVKRCTKISTNVFTKDMYSSSERFTNINCGNVRAHFSTIGGNRILTVVARSMEECECQRNYMANKKNVNSKKKSFSDEDL